MPASESAAVPSSASPAVALDLKAGLVGVAIVALVAAIVAMFVNLMQRQPPPSVAPPVAYQQQSQQTSRNNAAVEAPTEPRPAPAPPPVGAVPEVHARALERSVDAASRPALASASANGSRAPAVTPAAGLSAVAPTVAAAVAPAVGFTTESASTTTLPVQAGGAAGDPVIWNYWLTQPGADAPPPAFGTRPLPMTGPVELQALNRLTLRLSAVDLSPIAPVASIQTSATLMSTLEAAVADASKKVLELDVFITPSDEQRLRVPTTARRQAMRIDLDRLRRLPPNLRETPASAWTDQFIQDVAVAEFGFDFRVLVAGTHQVGVAIVDAVSAVPLQSMVINLSSGQPWPASVAVDPSAQGFFHPDSLPVDLSLILQALGGKADGSPYTSLKARLLYRKSGPERVNNGSAYEEVEWTSQQDIDALKQSTQNFTDTVGSSRNADALLALGYKFARPLFDPDSTPAESEQQAQSNASRAAKARQIIVDTANDPRAKLPPTMLVLIVKEGAQSQYASTMLPIGAMGVSKRKNDPPVFLGERFALALRLTDQDLSPTRPCPRDWYVALPKNVANVTDAALLAALNGLKPVQQSWHSSIYPQSPTLSELSTWLNDPEAASADRPYVLTYVGHHQKGQLSLGADAAQGIGAGDIRRDFQGSSIAILDACNTAMTEITNGMPIGMLAQRRVAAIVATTSGIEGDLAANYLVCMSSVLTSHTEDLTIGQTHALVTQCLWSTATGGLFNYKGSALKYVLVGNPFQRICAPPAGPPLLPEATPIAEPSSTLEKGGIS